MFGTSSILYQIKLTVCFQLQFSKSHFSEWLVSLCRVPWVQIIVVVVAKENMNLMMDIIQRFQHRKVRAVPGGSTRHRSICNGVLALSEEEGPAADRPKVVIIHDAVRPFVDEDFLHKIAVAAKEQGVSTIKTVLISPLCFPCLVIDQLNDFYGKAKAKLRFVN